MNDGRYRTKAFWLGSGTALAAVFAACSGSGARGGMAARAGGTALAVGGSAENTSAGGRGGSGITLGGPSGSGGDDAGAAGFSAEAGSSSLGPGDACALSTTSVEALPSVLDLVVDTSGSMDWPPGWMPVTPNDSKPAGATKWEITRDALATAVSSLGSDVALGMSFFPNVTEDDPLDVCLNDDQAVSIALLGASGSNARKSVQTALDGVMPLGGTPTEGAYRFGVQALEKTKIEGNKFLLLITDGTPTCTLDCTCTENNVPVDSDPLLADADAARSDGIRTFVIGSPGSEQTRDVLSALARRGGTAKAGCSDDGPVYCHFDMTTEPDLAAGLESALDAVAKSLRSCEYPVPPPPQGRTADPDQVNVIYTPSAGKSETLPRDASSSDCSDGWQYTDDGKHIELCGDACDRAKTDVGAKVEIVIGCKTVSAEPR
jgi:Mg-chelatase subunit ChlD